MSSNLGRERVQTSQDLSSVPQLRNIYFRRTKVKSLYLILNACKRPVLWIIFTAPSFKNLVAAFCFAYLLSEN